MRDTLTALAGAVILILVAALAAPPFIDWAGQRSLIDRAISASLGVPARSDGRIEVRLLPSPRLRLDRLQLGEGADRPVLDVRFVKAELALAPLLKGEFRFTETRIGRAELTLPVGEGDAVILPPGLADAIEGPDLVIEDLRVQQALVTTRVPATGRTDQFTAEGLRLKAPSLAGPWQAEGVSGGVPFRLASSAINANGASLKISGGGEAQPRFEADLRLRLRPLDPIADALALERGLPRALVPEAEGSGRLVVGAASREAARDTPRETAVARPALPFSLAGKFKARGGAVRFEGVEAEIDPGGQSVRLAGTGQINLRNWRAGLSLESRRLNLDGLIYSSAGQALLHRGLPAGGAVLPVMLDLDLKLDSLALGFEEWSAVRLTGTFDRTGGLVLRRLSGTGPGASRLDASGEVDVTPAPRFNGHVEVEAAESDALARVLRKFGVEGPAVDLLDGRALKASGEVTASRSDAAVHDLALALGETRLSGSAAYRAAGPDGRGRLEAALDASGLDVAELPPVGRLLAGLDRHDLDLTIRARDVRYGPAGARSGTIAASLRASGASLVVDSLDVTDLAGANARLSGRIAPDGSGRIAGRVTASKAAPLLALLDRVWIPETRWLPGVLREGAFDLDVGLEREAGAQDTLRSTLKGRAAGGTVEGSLTTQDGRLARLDAVVAAPSAGAWFGRSDIAGLKAPASLTLAAKREAGTDAPVALTLAGRVAGLALATPQPLRLPAAGGPPEAGTLTLTSADLAPFLTLAGAAATDPLSAELTLGLSRKGETAHAEVSGTVAGAAGSASLDRAPDGALSGEGSLAALSLPGLAAALVLPTTPGAARADAAGWSAAPFASAPEHPSADLALRVGRLDLGRGFVADGAVLRLALAGDTLGIKELSGRLAGGRVSGSASLSRRGGSALLSGEGALSDAAIPDLVGASAIRGRLSGTLRASASGESAAALVANLGGSGELTLSDLVLPGADPGAIDRTLTRLLAEDDPLREGHLQAVLDEELAAAPLAATAPVTLPVTLVGGTLRSGSFDLALGGARWSGGFGLDLRQRRIEARGTLTAAAAPKGWSGGRPATQLGFGGPLAAPQRTVEAGALANGLAALVLQREIEKVEMFDADQAERQRRRARVEMDKARAAAEKAAAEKAAQEKAAQEKAALEKAAQEKAAAEEAARQQRARQAAAEEADRRTRERLKAEDEARRAREEQGAAQDAPKPGEPLDIRPPQP